MADQFVGDYIYDPLDAGSDPDFLQQEAYDYIQSQWPDWVPNEGNLETWMIAVCARMVAEARDVATDVPRAIFRYYGRSVLGIPPIDATRATLDSTWNFSTNPAGRTIPIGTTVTIDDDNGEPHSFETISEVTVASPTLIATPVTLRASNEGEDENGLGGVAASIANAESIAWVSSITALGISTGATDGETDDEYLNRLSSRLTIYKPSLVLGPDYQIMARDIAAQNGADVRVLALDGYNALDGTLNNEGMVGVAMVDSATGANVSGAVKTAVTNELNAMREVNFIISVVDPTRTTVDVTFTGVSQQGADAASVEVAAENAISDFLSSANWGRTQANPWSQNTVVRFQDLSAVLNGVDGFDHWDTLVFGLNGGAQDATDKSITGVAPLAQPGTITGTVT
jgi:hypothetical protein